MILKFAPVTFSPGDADMTFFDPAMYATIELYEAYMSNRMRTDIWSIEIPEPHIRVALLEQHETIPEKRYTMPCNNLPYLPTPAESLIVNYSVPPYLWDIHESMYTPPKVYIFPTKYLVHPDVPPVTFLLGGIFYIVPHKKN